MLDKDFPIQGTELEVKTLTPSNVAFKVSGRKDASSNAINGDIEGKYLDFKNGLVLTQVCRATLLFSLGCTLGLQAGLP